MAVSLYYKTLQRFAGLRKNVCRIFFDFQIVANIAKISRCVSADITLPAERMYQLKPGSHYNEKEILTVSKTEMRELVKARAFVDKVTLDVPELEGASDLDRLNYFKAKFDFLFTDNNTEEK